MLTTTLDLAVIFRPGLIAHPEHEMLPREHDLSQKVLEFLIAQQDWFILDIPPPPQRIQPTSLTPTSMTVAEEGVLVQPSSDSGAEDPLSAGWKLVGKQTRRITRRRTQGMPVIFNDWLVSDSPFKMMSMLPRPWRRTLSYPPYQNRHKRRRKVPLA